MKTDWTQINLQRIHHGPMGSADSDGRNGAFQFRCGSVDLLVIASDGADLPEGSRWEHVSARARDAKRNERTPSWAEMCWLKDLFWEAEECVIQFHPPKSDYVNNHPHVLHLWRPVDVMMPRPSSELVGIK